MSNRSQPTGSVIFDVVLFANAERCDFPGYRQWLEAYDGNGKWCGTWNHEPNKGELPHNEMRVRVISRMVRCFSGTATEAMRLFDEWHRNGETETWLMNPDIR